MQVRVKKNVKYGDEYFAVGDVLDVDGETLESMGDFFEAVEQPKEEKPKEVKRPVAKKSKKLAK